MMLPDARAGNLTDFRAEIKSARELLVQASLTKAEDQEAVCDALESLEQVCRSLACKKLLYNRRQPKLCLLCIAKRMHVRAFLRDRTRRSSSHRAG